MYAYKLFASYDKLHFISFNSGHEFRFGNLRPYATEFI